MDARQNKKETFEFSETTTIFAQQAIAQIHPARKQN